MNNNNNKKVASRLVVSTFWQFFILNFIGFLTVLVEDEY